MTNLIKHLKVIHSHRKYVRKSCFKMGIPFQGLIHDLSKYSLKELQICKWYTGTYSPHDAARKQLGYSPSWYHHRNRNKHHSEYWVDSFEKMNAVKMPYKYVIEMFCDFIAAGKAYTRENWTHRDPWIYWTSKCKGKRILHSDTEELFEKLLWNLHEAPDEDAFYTSYKRAKNSWKNLYNEERES